MGGSYPRILRVNGRSMADSPVHGGHGAERGKQP